MVRLLWQVKVYLYLGFMVPVVPYELRALCTPILRRRNALTIRGMRIMSYAFIAENLI